MQIYKLFSSNNSAFNFQPPDSISIIYGSSEKFFGLRVEPERYREFLNSIKTSLLNNKIHQHIMTDYKFLELIRQSQSLNFELLDVSFYDESKIENDELYKDIKEQLWESNNKMILGLLEDGIESGYKILSITGAISKIGDDKEYIKIYANGTLSVETRKLKNNTYPILDFIIKGPEVFQ